MVLRPIRLDVTHQKLANAVGDTVGVREAETQENGVGRPGRRAATRPPEEYVLTLRGEMPVRIENLSCRHQGSREYKMTRLRLARLGFDGKAELVACRMVGQFAHHTFSRILFCAALTSCSFGTMTTG